MTWITTEYQREGTVFGVHRPYRAGVKKLPIFGETIETPFGPAAGPNTQQAQNIIAAYFAGARFFELKTVQKVDGADLAACINRPCNPGGGRVLQLRVVHGALCPAGL